MSFRLRIGLTASMMLGMQGVWAQSAPVVGVENPETLFTSPDPVLHRNKQAVMHIVRDLLEAGHWDQAGKYLTERYIQHHPGVPSGLEAVQKFFASTPKRPIPKPNEWKTKVVSVVAEGDLVVVAFVRDLKDANGKPYTTTWFDMWRMKDGKADEHWDGATLPSAPTTGG